MDAVGNAPGHIDVVIYNVGLVGRRIDFHQRGRGSTHTGKVQLPLEFKDHPVAGQIVFHRHAGRVAREHLGIPAPDIPLPEDNLGFPRVLVDRHNDRRPVGHQGGIKGVHAEGHLNNLVGQLARIQVRIQQAGVLHALERGFDVVVIDVIGGVVAGADVHIVAGLRHRPGVALAPVLLIPGQDAVHLSGAQGGMRDLVDGIAAVGIGPLLVGLIADIAVLVGVNAVVSQCCCPQHTHRKEEGRQLCRGFFDFHVPSPLINIDDG